MKRVRLCLLLASVAGWLPLLTSAQQITRLPTVAILTPDRPAPSACDVGSVGIPVACMKDGFRALGYVEGRNIAFEVRYASDEYKRLPALAAELVALRPEVLFTASTGGADAAAKATNTIPIIAMAGEPTLLRLAGNLARPTGNVTGFTVGSFGHELIEKCLQLLREAAPRTSRVAVIHNPDNIGYLARMDVLAPAASQLGITLLNVAVRDASELPRAFDSMLAGGADAVCITPESTLVGSPEVRKQLAEWAASHRLPTASAFASFAADGGLFSLGPDFLAIARRSATYVHRILGGAKPVDLPIERPTIFKLTVNRKTAAAIGVKLPQSLLLRADEVIA